MTDEVRPGLRPREADDDDDEPSNVLLLAPAGRSRGLCSDHVFGVDRGSRAGVGGPAVVTIEFPGRSVDRASAWAEPADRWPVAMKVISVDGGREEEPAHRRLRERAPPGVSVERVGYGDDLVLVGVEVAETLRSFEETHDDVVICVDSLTPLVELAGLDRTYRFLRVLSRDVRRSDIRAHYHLDPNRHDLQTTYLLESLADAFVVAGDVDIGPPRA